MFLRSTKAARPIAPMITIPSTGDAWVVVAAVLGHDVGTFIVVTLSVVFTVVGVDVGTVVAVAVTSEERSATIVVLPPFVTLTDFDQLEYPSRISLTVWDPTARFGMIHGDVPL